MSQYNMSSLRADSEDITNSLNDFFAQRQAAINLQHEALNNYDLEILRIGEFKDPDE